MTHKLTVLAVLALFLGSPHGDVAAQPGRNGPQAVKKATTYNYVRLMRDEEKEPVALQTATVRFASAKGAGGVTVDLVGVVHIGDREYYKKLNKQLGQYDVVLYELVAPPNTVIPKGGKRDPNNPLVLLQMAMKLTLGLESQTEQIDYTRKNFVHADLSPEQMWEKISKRGDTGLTLTLSIAADLLRQQNLQEMKKKEAKGGAKPEPEVDLLQSLLDPDGPVKLKRALAEQLAGAGSGDSGFGPTIDTILIKDRNAAAIAVLQKELAKGTKKIAIFYGAAHMPDFERRLRDDFDLRPQTPTWLDAWNLRTPPRRGLEDLFKFLPQVHSPNLGLVVLDLFNDGFEQLRQPS